MTAAWTGVVRTEPARAAPDVARKVRRFMVNHEYVVAAQMSLPKVRRFAAWVDWRPVGLSARHALKPQWTAARNAG
jgi:hypothetical protein